MRGYLHQTDAAPGGSDRWFHTGDLVRDAGNGAIVMVDRIKEVIKVRGLHVAPAEIEAVLLEHPAVREAAVVGVPSERDGEAPWAFVATSAGYDADAPALMAYLRMRLAPHKCVQQITFLPALPRGDGGKLRRQELRATASQVADGQL
jgi:acyl-coenzyme A synthetase/AMP-(fatty) acid ligase